MCCLITTVLLIGPRAGIFIWWLAERARWREAFDSFFLGFLGFLLMPWTTLVYVAVGVNGLSTFDWLLLVVAVVADLSTYVGGGYGNRDRIRR